ncbi:MAG: hypothetical protein K8R54_18785 [Bacteroidales bacterium]|nr:hypothetical protein [Bacteroidales bacterium]
MKYIFILLSFLFLSSCSVNKTFYEDGIIKTKKFKTSKGQKTKNYNKTGTLFSVKKVGPSNFTRILHNGKVVNEQIIKTKLKRFYETGFRKKKFTYSSIMTNHGFIYQYELLEYNKNRNLIQQINYIHYKREPEFIVKSGKNEKLEFSMDTILNYINKVTANKQQ